MFLYQFGLTIVTWCSCVILKSWSLYFGSMVRSMTTSVGTPPSGKHVTHISQWHVACVTSRTIIIRTTTIRIPLRICMMQFSYPDRRKERQMTFQLLLSKEEQTTLAEHRYPDNLHNASASQYIRIINICRPGIIVRIIN